MKPYFFRRTTFQQSLRLMFKLGMAGVLGSLASCVEHPSTPLSGSADQMQSSQVQVHILSRDLSQVIGERTYGELVASLIDEEKVETNARIKKRVEIIATRLVQQATAAYPFSREWEWEIHIVKSDDVNASCMPGGKMTINTGLLELTQFDEHKVATVLGHEIAHALLEHGGTRIGRRAVTMGTLQAMAQSFKMGMLRISTLADSLNTITLPMDRQHEREADLLGMQLMSRAGYNPVRGALIWEDMQDEEPSPILAQRLEPYLSSHPTNTERLDTLTQVARQLAVPSK